MLFDPKRGKRLDQLNQPRCSEDSVTANQFCRMIAQACPHLAAEGGVTSARVHRLIDAGAFTDAALALIELELPQWQLFRLAYEEGEWFCSLSSQPNLPAELDQSADGHHQVLCLAILEAFAEAHRTADVAGKAGPGTTPKVRATTSCVVCCDNFV